MKFKDINKTLHSLSDLTTAITRGGHIIELYFKYGETGHSMLYLLYEDSGDRDIDIVTIDHYLLHRDDKSINRFEDLGIKLSGKQEW